MKDSEIENLILKTYNNNPYFNYENIKEKIRELYQYATATPACLNKDLLLRNKNFKDESGIDYNFIYYREVNYLTNGIYCFACSPVRDFGKDEIYVEVIIIPNGNRIYVDINSTESSVIRYNTEVLFIHNISSFNILQRFVTEYRSTYESNYWYKATVNIELIKSSYKYHILSNLYSLLWVEKLLNPLELVIGNIYFKLPITHNHLFESLINKNYISYGIHSLTTAKFKPQIAKSTNNIFKNNEVLDFINTFSDEDIYEFFEVEYLRKKIDFNLMTDNHIRVIFNIGDLDYIYGGNQVELTRYKRESLREIKLTARIVQDFYELIRQNLLKLEELVRLQHGYDIVGTLYAERFIYINLKNEFPQYNIISQYSPVWLGRQRIDIFIEELNVAIEYNGKQHYEAIDFFGGLEGLRLNQERDLMKRNKCHENNVQLVEIRYDENIHKSLKKLISMIYTLSVSNSV